MNTNLIMISMIYSQRYRIIKEIETRHVQNVTQNFPT